MKYSLFPDADENLDDPTHSLNFETVARENPHLQSLKEVRTHYTVTVPMMVCVYHTVPMYLRLYLY